jgi:hypothetical protein
MEYFQPFPFAGYKARTENIDLLTSVKRLSNQLGNARNRSPALSYLKWFERTASDTMHSY